MALPPQALAAAMRSGPPNPASGGSLPLPAGQPPGAPPPSPPGGPPIQAMPTEQAMQVLQSLGLTPDKLPLVLLAVASIVAGGGAGGAGAPQAGLPPAPPPIE